MIGYARVSTEDQRLDMQLDALGRAGCDKVFYDHGISGARAERPGLDDALRALVEGDTLVVYRLDRLGRSVLHLADLITRLDNEGVQFSSLCEGINTATSGGRLVFHLFASVAEFERELVRERTRNGLRAAKERGAPIGRPRRLTDEKMIEAHRLVHQEGQTYQQTASRFDVSESTLQRGFRRLGMDAAA
ncbi:invertase [Actibacterium sp. EMB200-NS6]|nr:invertase [Actibacterium sp. EMB200-NS6]